MNKFKQITDNRHAYAREWKRRTGGKVLGCFCTYVPQEVACAAGVLPVRVLGSHEPQDVTEPHIYSMYCPFSRDVLAQGLLGRYDYLDGIVFAYSCLHLRQAYASWEMHVPTAYSYHIMMPGKPQTPRALPFFAAELHDFKDSLEQWTGREITAGSLSRATEVYNTNRRLLRQVYELRKADSPPLSGLEAMCLTLSSQLMDKAEHNALLAETLAELAHRGGRDRDRDRDRDRRPRLMLIGSENDDASFVEIVESLGATVVVDDHCTGSRDFWNEIVVPSPSAGEGEACPERSERGEGEPVEKLLQAIALRYLERPPCPTKDWEERRRWPHILKLAEDWRVDGAIIVQQKFCDPHEVDIPPLIEFLGQHNISSLFVEFDVTTPAAQFRTRVEAFLEMLETEGE